MSGGWRGERFGVVLALALAGCGSAGSDLATGEACVRTSQCGAGLACVANVCSTDLGPLGENGMVPDAGAPPVDAAAVDGGLDAGAGIDAGPGVDAGGLDAGTDAGQPDAGQPDAGQPDAGQPDAGQPDAGQPDAG